MYSLHPWHRSCTTTALYVMFRKKVRGLACQQIPGDPARQQMKLWELRHPWRS
jgi:hypothetical protein